MNVPTNLKL